MIKSIDERGVIQMIGAKPTMCVKQIDCLLSTRERFRARLKKRASTFLHRGLMLMFVATASKSGLVYADVKQGDSGKRWQKVEDGNLQECLEKIAAKKKWQAASEFSEVKCHSKKIKSVKGLEQFANLRSLSLYNNDITEFNVPAFSRLEKLNLANNEITQIALTNYVKLEDLYLFKNKLTQLTIKDMPKLAQLKANSNEITQFHYEALPLMEKVYLFDNKMEHIDIYSLPKLKYMDVRQNPMPDELYEEMDEMSGVTIWHDGNADDWN